MAQSQQKFGFNVILLQDIHPLSKGDAIAKFNFILL
jgi:hypothetical protein